MGGCGARLARIRRLGHTMEFSGSPETCWTGAYVNATRTCGPCFDGWQHSRGVMWNDDCMTPTLLLPVVMIAFTVVACLNVALILGVATRAVALALVPVLLGATWVHAGNGWVFFSA